MQSHTMTSQQHIITGNLLYIPWVLGSAHAVYVVMSLEPKQERFLFVGCNCSWGQSINDVTPKEEERGANNGHFG